MYYFVLKGLNLNVSTAYEWHFINSFPKIVVFDEFKISVNIFLFCNRFRSVYDVVYKVPVVNFPFYFI